MDFVKVVLAAKAEKKLSLICVLKRLVIFVFLTFT